MMDQLKLVEYNMVCLCSTQCGLLDTSLHVITVLLDLKWCIFTQLDKKADRSFIFLLISSKYAEDDIYDLQ